MTTTDRTTATTARPTTDLPIPGVNRLLVQRDPAPERSTGGVILPHYQPREEIESGIGTDREAPTGTVLAVGPCFTSKGARYIPDVKPGDRVLLSIYAGSEIDLLTGSCGPGTITPRIFDVLTVITGDPTGIEVGKDLEIQRCEDLVDREEQ